MAKTLESVASNWWAPVLFVAGLIPVNLFSPLLFHTLSELFAVTIAMITFVVAWNTYALSRNNYLMFLGVGYFWVGTLDLFHMLTFLGLPFFSIEDANPTLQIWVISRFFEAFVLLAAPIFIYRTLNRFMAFFYCAMFAVLGLWAVINHWVPVMYLAGDGLQAIKVISEYIIIAMLALAFFALWRERKRIDTYVLRLMYTSIIFTIAAELSFTLYSDLDGVMLMVGHLLKLISFWAIYVALIESSLKEPFRNLSREANTYDAIPDETVVIDGRGVVRQVNEAVRDVTQLSSSDLIGIHCHEILHPASTDMAACEICQAIVNQKQLRCFEFFNPDDEQWFEVSLSNIHFRNKLAGMVHVRRNITLRKQAEEKFTRLNRLYTVLSHTNKAILLATNREDLFQRICDITIQKGGFKMAWVGLIDGINVVPSQFAGDEGGYLKGLKMRADQSEWSNGPVGKAAKLAKVYCVDDVTIDPDFELWRDAAVSRGFQAIAAVPLKAEGQVFAIFTIYSELPNVFGHEMFNLLTTLSDDLSAAILHLDHEEQRVIAEGKLRQLSQAVEQSANAIIITNADGDIEYVNRSFIKLTGYTLAEVAGKKPKVFKSESTPHAISQEIWETLLAGEEWNGELQNKKKDGSLYWSLQSISPIKDEQGNVTHYLSTQEDNTELHEAQETIKKLAFYDPLTNLPNRRLLADRLDQAIASVKRYPHQMVAVMLFDLDNFKRINDSLGHKYGDMLLQHVAKSFLELVREEDTVSRLGGDEFTIILRGIPSVEKITDIASQFIETLAKPIELMGNQVIISSSIGISVYPQDASDRDTLMRNADMAMYHAKAEGKHNFQFYKEEMNTKAQERLLLENKLRHAVESGHFVLHYQPQVDLRTGELIGLEALIRWIDPIQGMISPLTFIPLAEETGMIGTIGDWVIRKACEENKRLQLQGFPEVKVAVNVSAYQFRHGDHLCDVIKSSLASTGLQAKHLSVELTESILIEDVEDTIAQLHSLKGLGITLAVDDFGTGYSSLSYLKRFPIDILKIDQSFIRDILDDVNDEAIVNAIIGMGRSLGLTVLAEGVETIAHRDYLLHQKCNFAQGYLYCKPKPADELLECWEAGSLLL
ncbi:EAL domain-containing protein [Alkalimarinus alittae]|uniref:EAL domain-containing protein n=1 Tax=Alkalimarinus alittae TaxID=2961619 RepID=A0ABY6N3Y3_9ALTE|nr:EAL domain-containing protein [Alkalimarinus alittae]UZE96745.1 EAL domain-containing protein [Alkalimarinus alittae]